MIVVYIALAVLLFLVPPIRVTKPLSKINEDYLSKDNTLAVKGAITVLIIILHFRTFTELPNDLANNLFNKAATWIGQLGVALIFFYSGYGIYEGVKKSGRAYVRSFPQKRLFTVWLRVALCVCIFIILSLVLKKDYSRERILLSFIGWEEIGFYNWFIFVILASYVNFILSFSFFKDVQSKKPLIVFFLLSLCLGIVLYFYKETCWWNTFMCLNVGMVYSRCKKQIDEYMSNPKRYCAVMLMLFAIFAVTYIFTPKISLLYLIASISFALLFVFISMKVTFRSKLLKPLAKYMLCALLFQQYIFISLDAVIENVYLHFAVGFIATLLASVVFEYLFEKLKNKIIK